MTNTALIQRRFQTSLASYDEHAAAQRQIAQTLARMLPERRYERIFEIGCGTGLFSRFLYQKIGAADWYCNDLNTESRFYLDQIFRQPYHFLAGDAVHINFPDDCNLIAAASCVQWVGDLPQLLAKIAIALKPQGLFLFNTFSADNLHEIRALTGQGLHYPSLPEWEKLIAPHFSVRLCHQGKIVLNFDHAVDVLRHLQRTGVTATGQFLWTRTKLHSFTTAYRERFYENGKITLSYTPMYYLLEKNSENFL